MTNASDFQFNITLSVQEKLDAKWLNALLSIIKNTGPDDILKSVQVYDEIGNEKLVRMRCLQNGDNLSYIVPLMRNLTEQEVEKVVIVWDQIFDTTDKYIIDTSTPYTGLDPNAEGEDDAVEKHPSSNADLQNFHSEWSKALLNNGWRYGTNYDLTNKTHPLLLPWEQLPRSYKAKYDSILQDILQKTEI